MVQFNFDANQHSPSEGYAPIPADEYTLAIDEAEIKPLSSGEGHRLSVKISVLGGPMANRRFYDGFNVGHPDPDTYRRANSDLTSFCHAIQTFVLSDTTELVGKPFRARVKLNPAKNGYDASNSVVWATAPELSRGAAVPAPAVSAPAQAVSAPAFGGAPQDQAAPAPSPAQGGWGGGQAAAQAGPAAQGGFGQHTGQPDQRTAPQGGGFDPNTGQPLQVGAATQPAQQQPAPSGNAGWAQSPSAQGGAPWGNAAQ